MYIYQNVLRNYALHQIYTDFEQQAYNYPKQVVDYFTIADTAIKYWQLNFFPVEYLIRPVINVYEDETHFLAGNAPIATLTENTDYVIDYVLGMMNFTSTYTPVTDNYLEVIYQYAKINLKQFMTILNKALRFLNKYFPNKDIIEYTATMAGLLPTDPQEVDKVDLTALPFKDVNTCRESLTSKQNIPFARKGKYIAFNARMKEFRTDFGYQVKESVNQSVPFYIEGNLVADQLTWDEDTSALMNQVFRFPQEGYDALIQYLVIEMYMTRLSYSQSINASQLKLNTMEIYQLVKELKFNLSVMVGDSAIARGTYSASERNNPPTPLSTNNI